jgi:uncharacterized membrane protein YebE (DUF533 family)
MTSSSLAPVNSMIDSTQQSMITPVNNSINTNGAGGLKDSALKLFLKKHKKKLLIGGGIIGVGTLSYFLLNQKNKTENKIRPATKSQGISGTRSKSKSRTKSKSKKIIEVKLS